MAIKYAVQAVRHNGSMTELSSASSYHAAAADYTLARKRVYEGEFASIQLVTVESKTYCSEESKPEPVGPWDRTPLLYKEVSRLQMDEFYAGNDTIRPLLYKLAQEIQKQVLSGNISDITASEMLEQSLKDRCSVEILRSQWHDKQT